MARQRQRGAFVAAIEAAAASRGASPGEPRRGGPSRNKYGAQKTGHYDSKREYAYAVELLMRKQATNGDVLDWLEQVTIVLQEEPRIAYRADFLVFKRDGTWELVEIKGVETDVWRLKMKLMQVNRPEMYAKLKVIK